MNSRIQGNFRAHAALSIVIAFLAVASVFVFPRLTHAQSDGSDLGYGDVYGDNLGYGDVCGDNLGSGDVCGYEDTYYHDGVGYSYSPSSSYSTPRYSPPPSSPVRVSNPSYPSYASYPQQQQQQQQQQQIRPSNITNNTCTDFSCNTNNTNVNTNINNSGNTSVAQVTPVYQTPVQYPVQYVFPQPIYLTYHYCPNIPS